MQTSMKLTVTYFLTDGEKICVEGDKTTSKQKCTYKVQNCHATPACTVHEMRKWMSQLNNECFG